MTTVNSTTPKRDLKSDQVSRVVRMVADGMAETWDLNDADRAAIDAVLDDREELLAVVTDYLAWGAMTGSDRDLFEERFTTAVANAAGDR